MTILNNRTQLHLIRHLEKNLEDLENIYDLSLSDKNYSVALKAKELQFKEIRALMPADIQPGLTKSQTLADIVNYFSQIDTAGLLQLKQELSAVTQPYNTEENKSLSK